MAREPREPRELSELSSSLKRCGAVHQARCVEMERELAELRESKDMSEDMSTVETSWEEAEL